MCVCVCAHARARACVGVCARACVGEIPGSLLGKFLRIKVIASYIAVHCIHDIGVGRGGARGATVPIYCYTFN